ncbi:hypothetical protein T484DRAFT_1985248 [Baffinella frigidus]|nr:hypothetical protein T484DRAFT_1985248 [Cryptophyta sp. CCMP2293]
MFSTPPSALRFPRPRPRVTTRSKSRKVQRPHPSDGAFLQRRPHPRSTTKAGTGSTILAPSTAPSLNTGPRPSSPSPRSSGTHPRARSRMRRKNPPPPRSAAFSATRPRTSSASRPRCARLRPPFAGKTRTRSRSNFTRRSATSSTASPTTTTWCACRASGAWRASGDAPCPTPTASSAHRRRASGDPPSQSCPSPPGRLWINSAPDEDTEGRFCRDPVYRGGGLGVIRKEAWPLYGTSSGVCLCWELEEPEGLKACRPPPSFTGVPHSQETAPPPRTTIGP